MKNRNIRLMTIPQLKASLVSIRNSLEADDRGEFVAWYLENEEVCRQEWRNEWCLIFRKIALRLKAKEKLYGRQKPS